MKPGFTIVEVMIVLAVVAILLVLATPAYQAQVLRAHRAEAIARLMATANCQERLRALRGRYDTSECLPMPGGRYAYDYSDGDAGPADAFTVVAMPLDAQSQDRCGRLALEASGSRWAEGPAETSRCWNAR